MCAFDLDRFGRGCGWDGEDGGAFDAEGFEEGAEDAADGGVGFDQLGHGGVGEQVAELLGGVGDGGGHIVRAGENAGEPAEAIRQGGAFGAVGFGGREALPAWGGAAQYSAREAGGDAGEALPDGDDFGPRKVLRVALVDGDFGQYRHDEGEAVEQ
ncbi:MAG: hypothetical protein B7Z58_09205 [Acidiphilium sp. 37-64-53]|nr:MAG: hypothetical protein B7Z58_09205 [Acidiphilium sp. 37-64-53]OZB30587.1 MAG: hypothetical protein B7X49_02560 [Acidiphilium sp. 34-64-41]